MVGHLQRALISYLEMLSVTQLDRQESSLTWMAYVSLNRHASMYAAPLVRCRPVTPPLSLACFSCPLFLLHFLSPSDFLSNASLPSLHLPPFIAPLLSSLSVIFPSVTLPLPLILSLCTWRRRQHMNLNSIQVSCISSTLIRCGYCLRSRDTVWNCLLICPHSCKVRCEPPLCSLKHRGLLCV